MLEEIEKLANELAHPWHASVDGSRDLARFVLLAMPVARAAMARPGCIFPGCELEQAVDAMRAALEEGK